MGTVIVAVVLGAASWLATELLGRPLIRFLDLRREIRQQLVRFGNVPVQTIAADDGLLPGGVKFYTPGRSGATAEQLKPFVEYAQQASVAMQAQQILRAAQERCIAEARKNLPIDQEETEMREVVSAAVRSAGRKPAAEPMPHLGSLGEGEFRRFTKENYGF